LWVAQQEQVKLMKITDVPQDNGMIGDYGHEICYAVGDNGRYILSPSLGWEAKNVVNDQAWEVIIEETRRMHALVQSGKLSPIAYYQAKHQMDIGLLSSYVGMAGWRVKRHRRPEVFRRLPERILERYATVFGVSMAELKTIPTTFTPELIRNR
jgi:hypothetical protein